MTLPIRIEHEAARELREAVRWYEREQAGLGGQFFDAVTQSARPAHGCWVADAQAEID